MLLATNTLKKKKKESLNARTATSKKTQSMHFYRCVNSSTLTASTKVELFQAKGIKKYTEVLIKSVRNARSSIGLK